MATSSKKTATTPTTSATVAKKTVAKKAATATPASKATTKKAATTPIKKTAVVATKKADATPAKKVSAPKTERAASKPAVTAKNAPQKSAKNSTVTPEERYRMIATAAYFRAEQRGFAGGYEMEDWIAGEAQIDAKLNA